MALRFSAIILILLLQVANLGLLHALPYGSGLKVGFYSKSCPKAEDIVFKTVKKIWTNDRDIAAGVLRIQLHDCFVQGCDASILLNSTKGNTAEKDAKPNLTLDGFEVFDKVKEALEKECPGVVSCADIIALAARDAVSLAATITDSGKTKKFRKLWEVESGRRDSLVSNASLAAPNLPEPNQGFHHLANLFASKGLSVRDMVVLSGAHAIGNAHCAAFERRLYNFSSSDGIDPTLSHKYALLLRKKCPAKPDKDTTVDMVPGSAFTFDNKYYKGVRKHHGLLHSDAILLEHKETRDYVLSRAKLPQDVFFRDFGEGMVKMGRIEVLTGNQGQIRKQCALVNP